MYVAQLKILLKRIEANWVVLSMRYYIKHISLVLNITLIFRSVKIKVVTVYKKLVTCNTNVI